MHGVLGAAARRVHGPRGAALLREVLSREVRCAVHLLPQVTRTTCHRPRTGHHVSSVLHAACRHDVTSLERFRHPLTRHHALY